MENIVAIIVVILIFSPKLVKEIKDYLLKKEQIKADTELRAEALRLKNSLDLEKFIENGKYEARNPNMDANVNDDNFDENKRRRDAKYE